MGWPGPMTQRQFLAWQEWLDRRWNVPSKADYYAAELIAEVRRSWVSDEDRKRVEPLLIRFGRPQQARQPAFAEGQEVAPGVRLPRRATAEDLVKSAKHDWESRLRLNGRG